VYIVVVLVPVGWWWPGSGLDIRKFDDDILFYMHSHSSSFACKFQPMLQSLRNYQSLSMWMTSLRHVHCSCMLSLDSFLARSTVYALSPCS